MGLMLAALGVLTAVFFVLKRRRWLPTVWNSQASLWMPHWDLGGNPLSYFRYFGLPLGIYIPAVTFSRSVALGRSVYDACMALTGALLGLTAAWLGGPPLAVPLTAGLFFVCVLAPRVASIDLEPEIYGYALAALALALTCAGLHYGAPALVLAGCALAGTASWVKISVTEGLWSPAAVCVLHGWDWLTVAGLAAFVAVLAVYLGLVAATTHSARGGDGGVSLAERLRSFMDTRRRDLSVRYAGCSGLGSRMARFARDMALHAARIAPLPAAYVLFLADPAMPAVMKVLTLVLATISLLHPLVRVWFVPTYVMLFHFPLALGAGLEIASQWEVLVRHPLPLAAMVLAAVAWAVLVYRPDATLRLHREKSLVLRRELIEPMAGIVEPGQWIFQDSYLVLLYLAFGCRGPGRRLLWMNYADDDLRHEAAREELLDYFRTRRPGFVFIHRRRLNLSVIERYAGLRYELVRAGYVLVYKLKGTVDPEPGLPSQGVLFSGAAARYEADKVELSGRRNSGASWETA